MKCEMLPARAFEWIKAIHVVSQVLKVMKLILHQHAMTCDGSERFATLISKSAGE